jgi:hypothetical protein
MQALDTLSNENDTLKKENLQLVDLATAKGVSWQCWPCQMLLLLLLLLLLCLHSRSYCSDACLA